MLQSFFDILRDEVWKYLVGVLFTVFLALGFRIALLINRGRMLRFFGISSRCPRLCVYLSTLNVEKATGIPKGVEAIEIGYRGPAIQHLEYEGAVEARDLLQSRRVAVLPKSVRELLTPWFISIALVEPKIKPSPEVNELHELPRNQNVISLGSHVYNSLFYVHNPHSKYFEFKRNDDGQRAVFFKQGALEREYLAREGKHREVGIIERVNDGDRSIFYCAGLGASATYGCVQYLVQNWKKLYEENGRDEFALYLVFRNRERDDVKRIGTPEEPQYVHRGKPPVWWRRLL
jgi:hypothetical protein